MDDIKQCPYCAEDIKKAAIVYKHCGRELPEYEGSAPSGASKRKRVDAELGREKGAAERKSHVKWWLSGLGVVSAFYAHPYGGPELWGNVGVSAVLWFSIGWVIDSFRESRWKKKSQDGTKDRQADKSDYPIRLKTYVKVGFLVVIVGIIVLLIYLAIATNGGRFPSLVFGESTRTPRPVYSTATFDPAYVRQEATFESVNATVAAVLPYLPSDIDCVFLDRNTFEGPFYTNQKYCLIDVVDARSPCLTSQLGPPKYWTEEGNYVVTFWLARWGWLRIVDSTSTHPDIRVGQCIIAIGYAKNLPRIQLSPVPTSAPGGPYDWDAFGEGSISGMTLIDATGQISLCPKP